jgi:acetyl-CoA acetyltransferase
VALVYGNNGRSQRVYYGGDPGPFTPWGFTSMGALHAMLFRRYMILYGATNDQLAEIPVTFRRHAAENDKAVMRTLIDRDEYHRSRWIVEPLHLYDYCLINDGGVCLIVTSEERAKNLRRPVVRIKATAEAGAFHGAPFYPEDFFFDACQRCARTVYAESGLTHSDMDALMIYDNFSPTVLFTLEGFGFCGRGEAAQWVQNGRLGLAGEFPTNTSGGHLSESYMQGWGLNVEAVRQLRGEAVGRQVRDCQHVQFMAATPISSAVIYERA